MKRFPLVQTRQIFNQRNSKRNVAKTVVVYTVALRPLLFEFLFAEQKSPTGYIADLSTNINNQTVFLTLLTDEIFCEFQSEITTDYRLTVTHWIY